MKNEAFKRGLRDGLPIGAGYFAVAFSIGIIARKAGISPLCGFAASWLTRASAGEYGVYSLMAAGAGYLEIIAVCFIANLRYLLMGASLSQKLDPGMPQWKRILTSCCITDEIFAISTAYPGKVPASYPLGATVVAATMWAAGTCCGIIVGNILPPDLVSALSVALYGMFIAIIVPPGKKDPFLGFVIIASFAFSTLCAYSPWTSSMGAGVRIVLLTILIAAAAAALKPVPEDE